jgi:hypothetical protein
MTNELPPALEACLDLVNDMVHPEAFGHAIPDELKTRAFVIKTMLERFKERIEAGDA